MDKFWEAIDTLARESGGGVIPSETLAGQGIAAVVLLLTDGRVAVMPTAQAPLMEGGGPGEAGDGGSCPAEDTPSVSGDAADSSLKEGALGGAAHD